MSKVATEEPEAKLSAAFEKILRDRESTGAPQEALDQIRAAIAVQREREQLAAARGPARFPSRSPTPAAAPTIALPISKPSAGRERRFPFELPKKRKAKRAASEREIAFRAKAARDAPGCDPRNFGPWVYAIAAHVKTRNARALDRMVRGLPHAGLARLAALGFERKRSMRSHRACAMLALFAIIMRHRVESNRRGHYDVTEGFTTNMLRTLFESPHTDDRPSRSAFDATSWGPDRCGPDDCGWLVALERAGCWEMNQPPEGRADPRYLGRVCWHRDGAPVRAAFRVFWIRPPPA